MKICRVLLGAVFTFLAMECQASTKPYSAVDIFEEGAWGLFSGTTPTSVKVDGFRTKNITDFDIKKTAVLTEDQKKSFVKHLFTSDDQHTFFTYALLEMAARGEHESGKYQTQSRATAILGAIQANTTDMMTAFTSNRNRVIILNRRQDSLDVIPLQRKGSFSSRSPVKSPTKPSAISATLRFSEDDMAVIGKRLGIDFNPKQPIVNAESTDSTAGGSGGGNPAIVPVKSTVQLEQEAIDDRWNSFLTSYYATDLSSKGDDALEFAGSMQASTFLIKPTTLVDAEERIRIATEHYNQELLRNIDEVRSLRTQVSSASIAVSEVDDMLTELGYDVSSLSLTSSGGKERVKEAMLALISEGRDFETALAKNTVTMKDLRTQIENAKG